MAGGAQLGDGGLRARATPVAFDPRTPTGYTRSLGAEAVEVGAHGPSCRTSVHLVGRQALEPSVGSTS